MSTLPPSLRGRLLLSCALGLLPVLAPSWARAQQAPVQLDTVTVEGEAQASGTGPADAPATGEGSATGPVEGYVAPTTTTGSKTATPIIEIPQSISVITTEQLEDRGVQNLGQALNYTAGVVSQPFGEDPRFFAPIIRGFDSTYSLYLNNFRFSRDFGAIAFEPYGQERIEVIKGPASVLYGQDEPGGIINLIQKRPTGTTFGEIGGEIGSDNRYVTKFDLGGVAQNDAISWRLTGLGRLADNQVDFVEDDRFYIAPTLTFSPDADTSLTILSSLQYDEGTSPIGVPLAGTLNANPNGEIPRSRYIGEPDFNDSESTLATVGYEFRHRFNETFEVRQNLQYVSFDSDYRNLYFFGLGADNRTVTRGFNVQSEDYDGFAVDNQLETKFETGALQHTTLIGLDYRNNNQWRSSNFSGGFTTIDLYDPDYGDFVYAPGAPTLTETNLQQVGLYAQDQIRLGGLVATLGLRQDWAENDNKITGEDRTYDKLTGRAGAVYVFDNGIAPYVSYSTSFNPTTGANTFSGTLLEPTEGEQLEGGVKFQPEGWNMLLTASVFEITKTNVTATEPLAGGGSVTTQTGEIRSRGFEFESTASLTDGLDLIGTYTYTDAEIVEGNEVTGNFTTGNRPQNVPEHAASLWMNYTLPPSVLVENLSWLEGVSVGAGVRYLGKRFGNDTNTIELPDVTLVDAAIGYEKGNYEARLSVNNIADKRYLASCNFGCFFGEGRKVLGSLTYKW